MKKLLFLALPLLTVLSCKESKKDILTKKWQAVTVENEELKKQISESRIFFDTVGKSTDAAANEILYGARNMDSLRVLLKIQLDSFVALQEHAVQNTWMDFYADSLVATSFDSDPDTVNWYFDDEGNLMLDELDKKGAGAKIKMEVLKLTDTLLQLRFNENGFSSVASFRPATK